MQHYDDETIAILAMDHAANEDAPHLVECADCRAAVEELRSVVLIGRGLRGDYPSVAPPEAVWARIVDELGLGSDVKFPANPLAESDRSEQTTAPEQAAVPEVAETDAAVIPLRSRRQPRRLLSMGIAAALGLIVGAGGMWAIGSGASKSTQIPAASVATASLAALDIPNTSGTAVLQARAADQRALTVQVTNLPVEAGKFYEVWLMDPEDKNLVALGVLGVDGRGAYIVPAGLDLSRYTAVDVSLQPMNGSPLHSSVSAVRGIMQA